MESERSKRVDIALERFAKRWNVQLVGVMVCGRPALPHERMPPAVFVCNVPEVVLDAAIDYATGELNTYNHKRVQK